MQDRSQRYTDESCASVLGEVQETVGEHCARFKEELQETLTDIKRQVRETVQEVATCLQEPAEQHVIWGELAGSREDTWEPVWAMYSVLMLGGFIHLPLPSLASQQ